MKLFINSKICVHESGRVEVYCHKLASRVNKELRRYDDGEYKFKEGEEAIFLVPSSQLQLFIARFIAKD